MLFLIKLQNKADNLICNCKPIISPLICSGVIHCIWSSGLSSSYAGENDTRWPAYLKFPVFSTTIFI